MRPAFAFAILLAAPAHAESWCAEPVEVHEWGVQVFGSGGAPRSSEGLPTYFHRSAPSGPANGEPVRSLPADSGVRKIPVVQFYGRSGLVVPLAIEVGFTRGRAVAWFPQVDVLRAASDANSATAHAKRDEILRARQSRISRNAPPLAADPTRQLDWERLDLTDKPASAPAATDVAWVTSLRAAPHALWVNRGAESDRFVFYEAATTERAAIVVERGASSAPGRRHLVLRNVSDGTVHDVFVSTEGFRFFAPAIPPHATAQLVLEQHPAKASPAKASPVAELRALLVDARPPARGGDQSCVMRRDPSVPVEKTVDSHLYAHEADALLALWGARFFAAAPQKLTLVYREDTATLDAMMPLAVYTDMLHWARVSRVGLALVEDIPLP